MSEEDFLSRWSRRKREAQESVKESAKEAVKPPAPSQAEPRERPPSPPPAVGGPPAVREDRDQPGEEFDLSALPPIDSITAATDITQFLRSGVPLELTRAALRRAWEADPAIRDFVGLAENAWDFNDPNAMAGFGPLDQTPEQVRELVARIVGDARRVAQDDASPSEPQQTARQDSVVPAADNAAAIPSDSDAASEGTDAANKNATPATTGQTTEDDAASHNIQNNSVKSPRGHGGALPR